MSRPTYDVIILGAGSVGVPAALSMAQAGLKVLVLDAFASQGQGSNKAAIGGIRATHSDPAKIRLSLRSLDIISTWKETYGHNLEWVKGGYTFAAYNEKQEATFKSLLKVQKSYGLNIDWHDPKSFLEIVPSLNKEGLLGGTFSPDDGHCSSLLLGYALFDQARREGAAFQFNEPVTAIRTEGGKVCGVTTVKGEYDSPVVVNAAGAWSRKVDALVGLNFPVDPDCHEAGITEPVAPFLQPMVVDTRPAPGSANYYFYQLGSGQIIFCITPNPSIWGEDRRETSVFLPMVAQRMVNLMPCLAYVRVRRTWRGLYPMTPDGSPLVGWTRELGGYLLAIGMCGQGLMLGPGLGELLSRTVTQQLTPEDEDTLQKLSPYRQFQGMEALK